MTTRDDARQRLASQRLAGRRFTKPGEVVAWMGAVQAQDRPAALWAIGLRMPKATQADVERAVERGAIVRTWPMRGTLHFVAAEDARWVLALLAPRAMRRSAGRLRELRITSRVLARSRRTLRRALAGGQRVTRPEAHALLGKSGIASRGQRGIHILGHLAQEGTLCLGPPQGKQPTFVLFDEWVPPPSKGAMPRGEALAELARRYFTSHGPASLRDFAWWSGSTLADARAGVAAAATHLARATEEDGEGGERWQAARPAASPPRGAAHALPAFDEFLVAYHDRRASLVRLGARAVRPGAGLLSPTLALDGQVVGTWTRALAGQTVTVTCRPLTKLTRSEEDAISEALGRYADFLGLDIALRGL